MGSHQPDKGIQGYSQMRNHPGWGGSAGRLVSHAATCSSTRYAHGCARSTGQGLSLPARIRWSVCIFDLPCLHYVGFEQQRVGCHQRAKVNASLAKAAGQQGVLPVAHLLLVAAEEQYENPRHDPMLLSRQGVDILLADFEKAVGRRVHALHMPPYSLH